MMGGAIHRPSTDDKVIVRHTEEVIAGANGVIPSPVDHITGLKYDGTGLPKPQATEGHPIRFINYGGGTNSTTAGTRTQIVYDANAASADYVFDGDEVLKFKNTAMGVATATAATEGDHIRIFWDEVVTGTANADVAVEVTISPETYPGTLLI